MAFAYAADGRIAGHLPQRLDAVSEQQCAAAHAGRRQRGFGAGVAAADHDHVKLFGEVHGVFQFAILGEFPTKHVAFSPFHVKLMGCGFA